MLQARTMDTPEIFPGRTPEEETTEAADQQCQRIQQVEPIVLLLQLQVADIPAAVQPAVRVAAGEEVTSAVVEAVATSAAAVVVVEAAAM